MKLSCCTMYLFLSGLSELRWRATPQGSYIYRFDSASVIHLTPQTSLPPKPNSTSYQTLKTITHTTTEYFKSNSTTKMRLLTTIATLTLTLLTLTTAIPITTPNPTTPSTLFTKRDRITHCGTSTYENQSSGGSPLIDDCLQLAGNIASGGDWTTWFWTRTIASYGTCGFSVWTGNYEPDKIGNQDVITIIQESIRQFSWQGLVGARGEMYCTEETYPMTWAIYHT
ncbi:putative necrosis-inducing factor-domain-containing protein [Aspergillus californicus]